MGSISMLVAEAAAVPVLGEVSARRICLALTAATACRLREANANAVLAVGVACVGVLGTLCLSETTSPPPPPPAHQKWLDHQKPSLWDRGAVSARTYLHEHFARAWIHAGGVNPLHSLPAGLPACLRPLRWTRGSHSLATPHADPVAVRRAL